MANQRIVSFSLFLAAILTVYVLGELLSQLWGYYQWPEYLIIGQYGIPWAISLGVSSVLWIVLARHESVNPFLLEVVAELKQVTWPTKQEIVSHTKVVILTVVIVAAILGTFDLFWAKVSKLLLNPSI